MKMMKQLLLSSVGALVVLATPGTVSAVELINLVTNEAGMHRISYAELDAKGAGSLGGLKHGRFALTLDGQSVPIRTKGQDAGQKKFFGPGGYIEFYAQAANSQYTTDVAYTLHLDGSLRDKISSEKHKYKNKQPFNSNYLHTTQVEDNRSYDFLAPSKNDPWHYGQIFGAGAHTGPSYPFELQGVQGSAELSVEVYGIVDMPVEGSNDHHPEIVVNGVAVADQQFDGTTVATLNASNVAVNNGSNSLQVNLKGIAGMPFDALALNKFSLTYSRAAQLLPEQDDQLQGVFAAGQAQVSGFVLDQRAEVYRKDTNAITRITGGRKLSGNTTGFNTDTGGEFIVVGANGYKEVSVALLNDLEDISSGPAEYLIITHSAFIGPELDALVQLREADYSVKVVDVAQVYGQFGNHVPSADAIHAYIKHAAANMGTRFVTLVGSDTYDYKHYISNSVSFIPTLYERTPGGFLTISQTPSDAKYGDLDDDDVPDLPIGRLSVRTPAELGSVLEKIRDYQARTNYAGRIVMAADKEDVGNGVNFTADASDLVAAIPQEAWRNAVMGPQREGWRAYPDIDGDQAAHDKLITAINAGVSVAAYIGHSAQTVWGSTTPILLTANDVTQLNNLDKPTLVTQWGCWNTYFVDPAGNSMGDQFLVGGETGAVAVLGASSLTTSSGERALGLELNARMYEPGMTIGEAIIQAKQAMAVANPEATDIYLGWQILGDPALVVNPE